MAHDGIELENVPLRLGKVLGSMIKHDHNSFLIAFYTRCLYRQFRVLLDFIFGNYEGNYINTTTINHTVSLTKSL